VEIGYIDEVAVGDSTLITDQILASEVDGETLETILECLLAAIANQTSIVGDTVTFMKRDGTTGRLRVTYGTVAGERTASDII
jgi:hypothetical protein